MRGDKNQIFPTQAITSNRNLVDTNAQDITSNRNLVDTNVQDISDNDDAISSNDGEITNIENNYHHCPGQSGGGC